MTESAAEPVWRPVLGQTTLRARAVPTAEPDRAQWVPVEGAGPAPDAYRQSVGSTLLSVLLGLDLAFLGLLALLQVILGLVVAFGDAPGMAPASGASDLWGQQGLNFVLFGVVPFLWVLGTRRRPWQGTLQYLGIRRLGHSAFVGVGLAGFAFLGVLILSAILPMLPEGLQDALAGSVDDEGSYFSAFDTLTWPLAIFIAVTAGVGEEILFRGVLQRWVGVWGQALLFVAAHMGNGYPLQWIVALAIGLSFGYLRKAGWSLVALMAAHAVYDLVLLGIMLILG